jgi:signal transduction histidine kinase
LIILRNFCTVFFILFFFSASSLYADRFDTLYSFLNSELSDQEKINVYNELALEYIVTNTDQSILYAKKAFFLSEETGYINGKADALSALGEAYSMLGEFEQALGFFQAAQMQYKLLNNNKGIGNTFSSIARIKNWQGKFDEAIHFSFLAIRYFQFEQYTYGIAKSYNTIGIAYDQNSQLDKAKQYYYRSFNLFFSINDSLGMANSLNNLAIVSGKEGDLDKSLAFFTKSLQINRSLNNNRLLTPILNNIGIIHKTRGQYKEAEKCFLESMNINLENNNNRGLLFSYVNISALYLDMNYIQLALQYIELATNLAIKLEAKAELSDCYETYSRIMEQSGDHVKALEYFKKHKEISDDLQNEKILTNIQKTEEKFELESKQRQLELQQKDNEILKLQLDKSTWYKNFILGILVSVFALLIMFVFQYRSKKKTTEALAILNNELSETNQKLVESESKLKELNITKDKFFSIISHDLRNPFASLVSFVRIMTRDYNKMSRKEVLELMEDMKKTTEKTQTLLENLLLWSKTQTGRIIYSPELFNFYEIITDTIQLYQPVISEKQISVHLFISDKLEIKADYNMIKTIFRNLISNAIKFSQIKGVITISFEETENWFVFNVEDTGIGMSEKEIDALFTPGSNIIKRGTADEKGSGIGLLICREFVEKHRGVFRVTSKKNSGSKFSVLLPKTTNSNS